MHASPRSVDQSERALHSPPVVLADEVERLLGALDAAPVEYALVGGLAVAVWGAPRATKDIDLLVRREALPSILEVAESCGFTFTSAPMTFRDGTELQRISKVEGDELLTLDLMLVNENLEQAWTSRVWLPIVNGRVCVVSRDALIDMKARAARPQDLYDIERLKDIDR